MIFKNFPHGSAEGWNSQEGHGWTTSCKGNGVERPPPQGFRRPLLGAGLLREGRRGPAPTWGCARAQRVRTVWAWVSQWSVYEDFSPWPSAGLFYSDAKEGILITYGKIIAPCFTRATQYMLQNELINESNPTPNKSIRSGIQKCKTSLVSCGAHTHPTLEMNKVRPGDINFLKVMELIE